MSAPLFKYGLFGDNMGLVVAFGIGIGFGFFLERAGFGSGRKLAAQFYGYDLTVFKVMFTAIITAMLGLYYLSVLGLVDLSLVYVSPTYLLPQIAGGLLLGFGFVIGGYCPGTSCVAAATGRIDGFVYLCGIVVGIFVFGESFSLIEAFYNSSSMGSITLPAVTGLSYGLVVFLVVLMALGGFWFAGRAEKKWAHIRPE
ncbi:YeeE/YedE family protein [candidate division KSB1 bacterium]|nr:YeeE/YedE family protein [candidate division KSB1 bacterium]